MAKRFGRNQRREMLALFKQLENDRLFGCAPAEPEDFVMSALPCELKTFSVTDEYERGRVERRVTCEMVVRAELKDGRAIEDRSEEHTSELQSLMRISYAVFCLKKKKKEY